MKVIIVGAGVIGALTAFRLAEQGAEVTVIEAGQPAQAASGASFGWINASFYTNAEHFALRHAAMAAHRRLHRDLKSHAYQWTGCLCWEEQGEAFDRQYQGLKALGYDVEIVDRAVFAALEPSVAPPERALRFGQEGAADLRVLGSEALNAACAMGARLLCGVRVSGVAVKSGRVSGVSWVGGEIAADRVVLATGVATGAILTALDVPLPMLDRPGLILRTEPLPPLVSHILVSPGQEVRQQPDGRLLAPTSAAHQSDSTEMITDDPAALASAAAGRLRALFGREIVWTDVTLAQRPVPGDGLPVVGACGPEGLYALTMHSGATLAPLIAEIAASEALDRPLSNTQSALIAPYRPQRFTG